MTNDPLSPRSDRGSGRPRFVVVMRHAEVFRSSDPEAVCEHDVPSRSDPDRKMTTNGHAPGACDEGALSQAGVSHARQVGDRLAETLANATSNETCTVRVVHARAAETKRTAEVVGGRLVAYPPPHTRVADESSPQLRAEVAESVAVTTLAKEGLRAPEAFNRAAWTVRQEHSPKYGWPRNHTALGGDSPSVADDMCLS